MRWFRIVLVPALLVSLMLAASFAWAEMEATEDELDERLEQVRNEGQAVRREAGKIDRKTRKIEIRDDTLREDLRVGHPFRSRRELRNDLRTNESKGRWYKRESLQSDFTTRRNQRKLRRLQRSRPRG